MKMQQTSLLNTYASLSTRLEAWEYKDAWFFANQLLRHAPLFFFSSFFFKCSPPPYVSKDGLS
jgi:hypothetical protein